MGPSVHRLPAHANATWDLVIIQSPNATTQCAACLLTFTCSAVGRYQQLWQLVQSDEWQELHVDQYEYIYLPENDVYHAVDQIDRSVTAPGMMHVSCPSITSLTICTTYYACSAAELG